MARALHSQSETLQRGKGYPLGDHLPGVGFSDRHLNFRAVWTGEKRPPKQGEWFLSGSIITAYRAAHADLSYPYHIAKIVKVTRTVVETYEDYTPPAQGA